MRNRGFARCLRTKGEKTTHSNSWTRKLSHPFVMSSFELQPTYLNSKPLQPIFTSHMLFITHSHTTSGAPLPSYHFRSPSNSSSMFGLIRAAIQSRICTREASQGLQDLRQETLFQGKLKFSKMGHRQRHLFGFIIKTATQSVCFGSLAHRFHFSKDYLDAY